MGAYSSSSITYRFGFCRPTPLKLTCVSLMLTTSLSTLRTWRAHACAALSVVRCARSALGSGRERCVALAGHGHGRVEPRGELDVEVDRHLALRPHDRAGDRRLVHLRLPHKGEERARLVAKLRHGAPRLGRRRYVVLPQHVDRALRGRPPVPLGALHDVRVERTAAILRKARGRLVPLLQQHQRRLLAAALLRRLRQWHGMHLCSRRDHLGQAPGGALGVDHAAAGAGGDGRRAPPLVTEAAKGFGLHRQC